MTTKKKKLSDMTGAELAAIADDVEREAKNRALWKETDASKARAPEREKWLAEHTTPITIRMPNQLLELIKAAAAVEGMGYQTLIKKWLQQHLLMLAKERRVKAGELASSLQADAAEVRALLTPR